MERGLLLPMPSFCLLFILASSTLFAFSSADPTQEIYTVPTNLVKATFDSASNSSLINWLHNTGTLIQDWSTYTGGGGVDFDDPECGGWKVRKAFTLACVGWTSRSERCVIDAQANSWSRRRRVIFDNHGMYDDVLRAPTVYKGIIMKNGYLNGGQSPYGGIMYIAGSTVFLTDVDLLNGKSMMVGGGAYIVYSIVTLTRCLVADNDSTHSIMGGYGGGLYVQSGSTVIADSVFRDNKTGKTGETSNDLYSNSDAQIFIAEASAGASSGDLFYGDVSS